MIVCHTCLSESHQNCKSIISIEKASKGVKGGTALLDLNKRLAKLTKVYENILRKQVDNQDNLGKCKDEIKTTISEVKTTILEHINSLEDKLINDFYKEYDECQRIIVNDREDIQLTLESVTSWKKIWIY